MFCPLVSVVIPNYNYAKYVGQAIESALSQDYPNLEVIVVDNGSTDDSLEVLKAYAGRIRVISQENRGQSGSRNRGIEESQGELIALLDADDVWLPGKLSKQIPFFARPEVGMVYGGFTVSDIQLRPLGAQIPVLRGRLLESFATGTAAVISGGESTAVIRKEAFERLGKFDPRLSISAGWDMYRRIAGAYEIELVAEPVMLYRQHGSNASARVDISERDVELILKKMFEDPSSAAIRRYKNLSYGKMYLALSGAYLHAGMYLHSLRLLSKAAVVWPPGLVYAAISPFRAIRRKLA